MHVHRHHGPLIRWRLLRTAGFWLLWLPVAAFAALFGTHGWVLSTILMAAWVAVLARKRVR